MRSTDVLKALIGMVLLAFLGMPATAAADCCICEDCPSAGARCFSLEGCDFGLCEARCADAGCAIPEIFSGECSSQAVCPAAAPASSPLLLLVIALAISAVGFYHLRRRNALPALRAVGLIAFVLGAAVTIHAAMGVHSTGVWQSAQQGAGSWSVDLEMLGDGSTTGTVEIEGFSPLRSGLFQGTIGGHQVSGTVTDTSGNVVATVSGSREGHSLDGQYSAANGDSGTFTLESDPDS